MKRNVLILFGLTLLAGAILFVLNIASSRSNEKKNGFIRTIVNNVLQEKGQLEIPTDVMKIINVSNDTVYLQTNDPELIYYTTDFLELKKLKFPFNKTHKFKSLFTSYVDYPNVYILGGNARRTFKLNLTKAEIDSTNLLIPGAFGNSVHINSKEWIVRYIDSATFNSQFARVNIGNGQFVTEDSISPRLNDAGFTNDGILVHEENTPYLSFIQFYNNQITLFDTAFIVQGRFHTIDTCFSPGITLRKDSTGVTNSAPPHMVNGPSAVENGYVYVHSYLRADNETQNQGLLIIDRYDQKTGKYINSFYLPPNREKHLLGLYISNNNLYALYNRALVRARILK